MRGIYWYDVSRSDKCRYNCHLHQRCAAVYESQNSRCSWVVLWWMFDHDWKQYVAAQIKKLNEKCLLILCYCHSLNLAVRDILKNIPLLNNTLDTCYEITDKKKQSYKRGRISQKTSRISGTNGMWFQCIRYRLTNSENLCPTRWTLWAASLSPILKSNWTLMKL